MSCQAHESQFDEQSGTESEWWRTRTAAAEAVLQQVIMPREERLRVADVAPLGDFRDKFVHHELFNTAAISKAKTNSRQHKPW